MRTIKFRAWIPPITDGEVTLPGRMDYDLEHRKYIAIRTETRFPPANFGFDHIQSGSYFLNQDLAKYEDRLMQFTGLTDKNGKEIYEGDIVEYVDMFNKQKVGVVEYRTSGFVVETAGWFNPSHVIGDIYSTPSLIK